jgi:ribonuclease HII
MENFFGKVLAQPDKPNTVHYEEIFWQKNQLISGIDEVGRGCLAGPVVACSAVLHPQKTHPLLKDSKILTENQRLKAVEWIKLNAWYAFGIIDHTLIDKYNIYKATQMAMKKSYYGLISQPNIPQLPELVLIDAMPLDLPTKTVSFTKGESKSISIAAASILAKVMRDTMMQRFSNLFPGYSFEGNKGYGAQKHQDALQKKGQCLIHRKSFLSSFIKKEQHADQHKQTSLFC